MNSEQCLYSDLVWMNVPETWSPVTAWMLFLLVLLQRGCKVVSQMPRTCLQNHCYFILWTWCIVKKHLTLVPLQPPLKFFFLCLQLIVGPSESVNPDINKIFLIFLLELSYVLAALLVCIWNCFHWADVEMDLMKSKAKGKFLHLGQSSLQGLRAAQWRRTLGY